LLVRSLILFTWIAVHFKELEYFDDRFHVDLLRVFDVLVDFVSVTRLDLLANEVARLLMDHLQVVLSDVFQFFNDSLFEVLVVVALSFQQELAQVLPIQSVLIRWHQKLRIQSFNVQLYFLNELFWKVFTQIRIRVLLFEALKSLAFFKTRLAIFLEFFK